MDYIIPFLVETAADPLTQSLVHRAVINQEHEELPYTCIYSMYTKHLIIITQKAAIAIDHAPR